MRPVANLAQLDASRLAELEHLVGEQNTLEQVVRWALMSSKTIENVVQQDEYTQDVVISDGELCLVYDTT